MKSVLPPRQQALLHKLRSPMRELEYALVDGTAVALYFGHRLSVDLDWFTNHPMGDVMTLAATLRKHFPFQITDMASGTLHIQVDDVRVSFLEYLYPLLEPVALDPEFSCPIVSLDDLACMKLSAIAQRGARKDFIDLYTLIQRHRPLPDFLDLYQKKYAVCDVTPVLYGMVYFDHAVAEPLPEGWQGSWRELEDAFRLWVREIWHGRTGQAARGEAAP